MLSMNKTCALYLCLAIVLLLTACDRGNATLGRLPHRAAEFAEQYSDDMPSAEDVDRLHAKLYPQFLQMRDREVPFEQDSALSYIVEKMWLFEMSGSCDVRAKVQFSLTQDVADSLPLRIYYKCVDGDGRALTRGMVLPLWGRRPTVKGDVAQGEALFHLVVDGRALERFDRVVFVGREAFNAAASEMHEIR